MDVSKGDSTESFWRKIRVLSELAWDNECQAKAVEYWLENFDGKSGEEPSNEKHHALHLLSNFLYFGHREVRELLRALYRDIFKYRLIEQIRRAHGDTLDADLIDRCFQEHLKATRFVPLGNPSESSSHLLYYFRQVNEIDTRRFAHIHDVVRQIRQKQNVSLCVFIDDFCGTGQQAVQYAFEAASTLQRLQCKTHYYVLVAVDEAIDRVRDAHVFDEVQCVVEITSEYRAFSNNTLYYMGEESNSLSKDRMKAIAEIYGRLLDPLAPLGFGDGELLLGFCHNVPDNTLPIFRSARADWQAPFPRYPKWGEG